MMPEQEYQRMYDVERHHWWYKTLHKKVAQVIESQFGTKSINILDMGCGTGGLMQYLIEKGYKNLSGFDLNPTAISLAKNRGLNVWIADISDLSQNENITKFDVIICNDVLCFFENDTVGQIVKHYANLLNEKGLFITNNNAFSFLRGTHDLAVGSQRRFTKSDFTSLRLENSLQLQHSYYWSFILFWPIFIIRQWQRLKLLIFGTPQHVVSDIDLPPIWLNSLLINLLKYESKYLKNSILGSSIFVVFQKGKNRSNAPTDIKILPTK